MTIDDWVMDYPEAASALQGCFEALNSNPKARDKSESWAQQQTRFAFSKQGGLLWRNNVGATMSSCPNCREPFRPVRYGLANESKEVNQRFKSSDLIGVMPRVITPDDIGVTFGQFVAIETKRPGWSYSGDAHERAQAAYLALVASKGGYARFSTGSVDL